MIRVLAVASEIFPLVKTGGLGDVTGALPLALDSAGAQTVTLIPGYPAVLDALHGASAIHDFPDLFGGPATIRRGQAASLDLLVLDAPTSDRMAANGSTTACASPASARRARRSARESSPASPSTSSMRMTGRPRWRWFT